MNLILKLYRNWKYKNTTLLVFSLILLFVFANSIFVKTLVEKIASFGYLGIFVSGIFFVSVFTVAPASVVLYLLTNQFSPLTISLVAGLGATMGDLFILRFLKDRVFEELAPVFKKVVGYRIAHLFQTPYFAWLSPVVGILIIASPFPDEIGIALLGVAKLKSWQFFGISFFANFVGIFLITEIAQIA